MVKINIKRTEKTPSSWALCCSDEDYGLFHSVRPREKAMELIHQVFNDSEIERRMFVYKTHIYRGHNSMKDTIDVYCTIVKI